MKASTPGKTITIGKGKQWHKVRQLQNYTWKNGKDEMKKNKTKN
uniref:Uncharacterized protein n=1 Tax=Anguilla anguilla TaxID=7936 RepID=A0A0E9UJ87_ANGAN